MKFKHRIQDVIRNRSSVRTYQDQALRPEDLKEIQRLLSGLKTGPMDQSVRFKLIAAKSGDPETLKGLGTYGMIRHPAGFVIGAAEASRNGLLDFGFLMESIVLMLTDRGIGTCWLGGTLTKSRFAECIGVRKDEQVPAVISIGYPPDHRTARERLIRFAAGSKKRKSWDALFFHADFHTRLSPERAGMWSRVLEMVRLAPSASNRQPWRIVRDADNQQFHFYVNRSRAYEPEKLGMSDLQMVDMGIAMSHFMLTAKTLEQQGGWITEDPDIQNLPSGTEYVVSWKSMH